MQEKAAEKRRTPRFARDFGVICFADVSPCFNLQFARNLSREGLFIEGLREDVGIGQKIFLEFDLPYRHSAKKIKAVGRVVWKAGQGRSPGIPVAEGVGVELLKMHDLDRRFLGDYLQSHPTVAS